MSALDIALPQIKRHEGLRLHPYRDTVGKLTVGYGRNLDDLGITGEEAEALLENDLGRVMRRLAPLPAFRDLDDVRQAVLINMAFNLGYGGLLKFKRMWAAIEAADYDEAARQMLDSLWARQVGRRATELADMMQTGETS